MLKQSDKSVTVPSSRNGASAHRDGDTRPEDELLAACSRVEMEPKVFERIKSLVAGGLDWDYLLRMAPYHGVLPLLYWNLSKTCPDDIPRAVLDELKTEFDSTARHNLHLTAELCKMLRIYDEHGILAVPYKGPLLTSDLYGNLALRSYVDIDVIVRQQDVSRAIELVQSQGYLPMWDLTPARMAQRLKSNNDFPLVRPENRLVFEVQWRFVPAAFSFRLNADILRDRLDEVSFGGMTMRTLATEDLLIVLSVHATKHLWRQLKWICDIQELLRVHPELDWNVTLRRARALGVERMLLLGLLLVQNVLGATLPERVRQLAQAQPAVRQLAEQVPGLLFPGAEVEIEGAKGHGKPGYHVSTLFYTRAMDRLQDRIGYCYRFATTVAPEDYDFVSLPDFLFPMYRAVRLARLGGWLMRWIWRRATTRIAAPRNGRDSEAS